MKTISFLSIMLCAASLFAQNFVIAKTDKETYTLEGSYNFIIEVV